MTYETELKDIARHFGLRKLRNADGSRVTISSAMVVAKAAEVMEELRKLREAAAQGPKTVTLSVTVGKRERGVEEPAPPVAPPAAVEPAAKKAKVAAAPTYIARDQLDAVKLAYIDQFADFPPAFGFQKLVVFKCIDNGCKMVALGYNQKRPTFAAKSVRLDALLNASMSQEDFLKKVINYRIEAIAKQVGDILDLVEARTQRRFWDEFGGNPRELEAYIDRSWRRVRILEFRPRSRRPVIVEFVNKCVQDGAGRYSMKLLAQSFRECNAESERVISPLCAT